MPYLETERGVTLHWEEAGAGSPVVFVHGWSMSSRSFAWQLEATAPSHRAIAYDLRGHGRSRREELALEEGHALEDHARDLSTLMEQLELSGAALVGWSMGGQVALEALPAIQDRLAALVLISTTPRFTVGGDWPHGLTEASVRALAARLEHKPQKALQRFFEGMFVAGELHETQLVDIERQVLAGAPPVSVVTARRGSVVHGERDPICLPAASAFAQAHIPGARRWVLPRLGHAPHLSRPALVNELLARFLAELS